MRNIIKRIISATLAFVITVTLAVPAFAQSAKEDSFAFEFPFMVANEEKTVQLYKDGDELYIAHDSVPLLGEIKDHGSYFERTDGAAIILDNSNTLRFDGIEYHPFEDIMIRLCLNSLFVEEGTQSNEEKDQVVIVPANNIFNTLYLSNRILDTPEINLYGYNYEYYKDKAEEADVDKSIISKLKDRVVFKFQIARGVEFVHSPKEFEIYNIYRTALWDIMLPQSLEIPWISNYHNELLQGAKLAEFIAITNEGVATLVTKPEGFLSRTIGSGIKLTELFAVDDYIKILEFSHNMDNIDSSIENAVNKIQQLTSAEDNSLKKAINDTVDLYNDNLAPSDIYKKHISNEMIKNSANIIDLMFEVNGFAKAIKLVIDGYDLYAEGTYDESLKESYELAFATLAVQYLAGDAIRQTRAELGGTADCKQQVALVKDLRDLLIFYLIAGNNVWEAVGDEKEFKADKKSTLYAIEEYYLPKLTAMSYVDFEVYLTAEETKEKLLAAADKAAQATPAPSVSAVPTAEPVQTADNQFVVSTKYNDYIITYDDSLFKLEKAKYGTGMSVNFAEQVAVKLDKYYTTNVNAGDSYRNFDEYYVYMKSVYPMEYIEGNEVQGVGYGEPVAVNAGGGYTVKYFGIDYISTKAENSDVYTNRYCYLDMGNGEGFYWDCGYYENHLDTLGISHEQFIQKLFVDIKVVPTAQPPAKWDSGLLEMTVDGTTYRITYNPDVVWVDKAKDSDTIFHVRNKGGIADLIDAEVRDAFFINSEYSSAKELLDYYGNLYLNRYNFVENVSVGEYKEISLGSHTAHYFLVSYHHKRLDMPFNDECCFAIELENGKVINGTISMPAKYGNRIGLTYKDVLENTFQKIEILK